MKQLIKLSEGVVSFRNLRFVFVNSFVSCFYGLFVSFVKLVNVQFVIYFSIHILNSFD